MYVTDLISMMSQDLDKLLAERDRYKRERDELAKRLKPFAETELEILDYTKPFITITVPVVSIASARSFLSTIKD